MNRLKTTIRLMELDGLTDSFVRIFKADKNAAKDAFIKATMSELESMSSQITSAILQDKTNSNLREADDIRRKKVSALGKLLSAYSVFPIANKRILAMPIKSIYDKYAKAGIASANYASTSSMVESLLEELSNANLSETIANLEGVSEAIVELRNAQDDFTRENDNYIKAKARRGNNASSYKKPITELINKSLVPYLDAMLIAKNASCLDFAMHIEAEINRANDNISKRAGRTETSKNAEETVDKQGEVTEVNE